MSFCSNEFRVLTMNNTQGHNGFFFADIFILKKQSLKNAHIDIKINNQLSNKVCFSSCTQNYT